MGLGSFGHHYCLFDAIMYNSWVEEAISQLLFPTIRDKNKGCGDTCLFTVAAAEAENWEKHIQLIIRKKKKIQFNLSRKSAYIIIQYTYLEGIFSLKSRMGRQEDKIDWCFA